MCWIILNTHNIWAALFCSIWLQFQPSISTVFFNMITISIQNQHGLVYYCYNLNMASALFVQYDYNFNPTSAQFCSIWSQFQCSISTVLFITSTIWTWHQHFLFNMTTILTQHQHSFVQYDYNFNAALAQSCLLLLQFEHGISTFCSIWLQFQHGISTIFSNMIIIYALHGFILSSMITILPWHHYVFVLYDHNFNNPSAQFVQYDCYFNMASVQFFPIQLMYCTVLSNMTTTYAPFAIYMQVIYISDDTALALFCLIWLQLCTAHVCLTYMIIKFGTLQIKCFLRNVCHRISAALFCPIWFTITLYGMYCLSFMCWTLFGSNIKVRTQDQRGYVQYDYSYTPFTLFTYWIIFHTLKMRQNGHNFADNILKLLFLYENCCILIQRSLKFLSKGTINIMSSLVQITVWHQIGDKSLSEHAVSMMTFLLMHICIALPWWVKLYHKWGLWCQKQVSQAEISNCIPQYSVGCNYLSMPEIPTSGTKVLKYVFAFDMN